jgi:hypothetical protein
MSEEPPDKKQKSEPPTNGSSEAVPPTGSEQGSYPYWGSYSVSLYLFGRKINCLLDAYIFIHMQCD